MVKLKCNRGDVSLVLGYLLTSQFCPVQPGRHSQKYPPIRFRHTWAFTHGFSAHSSASRERERDTSTLCVVRAQRDRQTHRDRPRERGTDRERDKKDRQRYTDTERDRQTDETGFADPLRRTDALEAIDEVHTRPSVVTQVRLAVVFVCERGHGVLYTHAHSVYLPHIHSHSEHKLRSICRRAASLCLLRICH